MSREVSLQFTVISQQIAEPQRKTFEGELQETIASLPDLTRAIEYTRRVSRLGHAAAAIRLVRLDSSTNHRSRSAFYSRNQPLTLVMFPAVAHAEQETDYFARLPKCRIRRKAGRKARPILLIDGMGGGRRLSACWLEHIPHSHDISLWGVELIDVGRIMEAIRRVVSATCGHD